MKQLAVATAVKISHKRIKLERDIPKGTDVVNFRGILPGRVITMEDVEELFGSYTEFKNYELYGDKSGVIAVKR